MPAARDLNVYILRRSHPSQRHNLAPHLRWDLLSPARPVPISQTSDTFLPVPAPPQIQRRTTDPRQGRNLPDRETLTLPKNHLRPSRDLRIGITVLHKRCQFRALHVRELHVVIKPEKQDDV